MRELMKQQLTAIEAVARHFSAGWEKGKDSTDAYLMIAGKRVAVEVAAIKNRIAGLGRLTKPRLRFDKVALRLVRALQANLSEVVPDGEAVIVTVTAPIRLASKTAAAVEDEVRMCLARRSPGVEIKDTIHGNEVGIRHVKGLSCPAPKVIGFVHNPDSDPGILMDVTHSLLKCIGAAAAKRAPARFAGDRWLVVAVEGGLSHFEIYRQAYSHLSLSTAFQKILMVLADGRVEMLSG
jgi:hypothetical protein